MKSKFNYLLLLFVLGIFISCTESSDEIIPNDDTIVDSGSEDENNSNSENENSDGSSGGNGSTGGTTSEDAVVIPDGYIAIYTAEQLASIGVSDDYPLDGNYIVMNDIDLAEYDNWTPIGTSLEVYYSGNFDGGGHTIRNLTINSTSDYQGLFGLVYGGFISNLIIDNPQVKRGLNHTGTICGCLRSGSITTCGVTGGSVEGSSSVGGVVGLAYSSSLTACYNTASVVGSSGVGGVVGYVFSSSIVACYNIGSVVGDYDVGSVVAYASSTPTFTACYYIAGVDCGGGTRVSTLAELNSVVDEMNSVAGSSYFTINSGNYIPSLFGEQVTYSDVTDYVESITIRTVEELKAFRDLVNSGSGWYPTTVTLTSSINLNGEEWTPIKSYVGSFDGRGYTISNLTINSEDAYQGLFSSVNGGSVSNLIVDNPQVKSGGNYTGAICGYLYNGSIIACGVTGGSVVGSDYYIVGGVVGRANSSLLIACYNTGSVEGDGYYAGGVVGLAYSSSLTACYNTGSVVGNYYVGGVVGIANSSPLIACYNTGSVEGNECVGGVLGYVYSATFLTACYFIDQDGDDTTVGVGNSSSSDYDYMVLSSVSELNAVVTTMNSSAGSTYYTEGSPSSTHLPYLFDENLKY